MDPGGAKYAGTWFASAPGVMALAESFFFFFFKPLVAVDQMISLASLYL